MAKYLDQLNLNKNLRDQVEVFEVKPKEIDNKKFYEITLETKVFLSLNNFIELVQKISRFEQAPVKTSDIKLIQPSQPTKGYEVYPFIRYLFDSIFNVTHSDYYVDIKDGVLTIVTSKQKTMSLIETALEGVKSFLKNFGIFYGEVKLIVDEDSFNYKNYNTRKTEKITEIVNSQITNPNPKSGYKLVSPIKNKDEVEQAYFEGEVYDVSTRTTKSNLTIVEVKIARNFIAVKSQTFLRQGEKTPNIKKGQYVRVYGKYKYSSYSKEFELGLYDYEILDKNLLEDKPKKENPDNPRSEFHVHTRMSQMDGVSSAKEYVEEAKRLGIKNLAITDHNSVQSFPEFFYATNGTDIKPIYGVELDVIDDINTKVVYNEKDMELNNNAYVYFDLETTGISPFNDQIIEFGGVRVENGMVKETKQLFIKPTIPIPETTTKLTNISDSDVQGAPSIEEAIPEILEFLKGAILVAHNAEFDLTFLNSFLRRNGYEELDNVVIDSLKVSWILNKNSWNHRLGTVARIEGVVYDDSVAHRADYDAKVLYETFENMIFRLLELNIRNVLDLNKKINEITNNIFASHVTVYAKNNKGLKQLYKIISESSTKYFNTKRKSNRYPLSKLLEEREDLIIGSACNNGLAFKAITLDLKDREKYFKYFDFIEIFPTSVYRGEVAKGFYTSKGIKDVLKEMYFVASENNILTVATSNAHYSTNEKKFIRDVYISSKGLGGAMHPLYSRNNPTYKKPDQYLRSTDKMISSMELIFDEATAYEIAVTNSNKLAEQFEEVIPLKKDLYTPKIEGVEEKFKKLIYDNLEKKYGSNPPSWIKERVDREVESITRHGYSIIYYLSSLAVRKSLEDGYLVGSRGSVGSSIAATFSEITEVNPLEPHYLCDSCKHVEKVDGVGSGYDLVNKQCPKCQSTMKGEGQDIPFETFLGFNGDKVPDIDLNFSGEYQPKIHNYIRDLLGDKNVYRAGTISTVAQKTAFGYLLNYYEENELEKPGRTTLDYLSKIVEGTKRTTGQHPGGLIVVPDDMDIEDFSPINYPGNDVEANWKTTHFDFHSIHDNLLKLDLLGHIDPSAIRMLEDITGVNSLKEIPMNDERVMSLFKDNSQLKITEGNFADVELGILGIPEFGTGFVRELVADAKPKTFADLVRISGLSHGTDVWLGNAKDIIDNGDGELKDVISVRDDIMTFLIRNGLDASMSFQIMESVRKGKGLKPEWEEAMVSNEIPKWYIESCKKIKYMFPKAHATAYVMMAYRIAWYKINYPLAYYATFFTKRDTEFDVELLRKGPEEIKKYRAAVKEKGWQAEQREKVISSTMLIVLEMLSRGYKIEEISLEKSHAENWIVNEENNSLIPPFSIFEGLGVSAAEKLQKARDEKMFESVEDFEKRCQLNKTQVDNFKENNLLKGLSSKEEHTYSIFDEL